MKKLPCTAAILAMLLCPAAFASSGTLTFHGAIVNTPCTIPANTWLHYAQNPAQYRQARQASSSPSCADATATQSVQLTSHIADGQRGITSNGSIVTVVYN